MAQDLLTVITGQSQEAVSRRTLVPPSLFKNGIIAVSRFAFKHKDLLDQELTNHSYFDMFVEYNENEISAATILLML